jgi:hypothetical protein
MPDWSELTNVLARDAQTRAGAAPTEVAQRYEERFGRVQLIEAVREVLHPDRARPGSAHRAFVRLPFDTVYTSNFDMLLEDAYLEASRPFRSLVGELQIPFHAGQIASSIIKLHGDIRHEENVTITQSDYDLFLERYPVVATHLSAMLITRTALFVGYSFSDPDFLNIRNVVRARLGLFERMAYSIQFDVPAEQVEKALGSKFHIISLDSSSGLSRTDLLASFFAEIREQLDVKASAILRRSRPDLFEVVESPVMQGGALSLEQSLISATTSRLCFVMMPYGANFDRVYRLVIAPAVRENGLEVLRADETSGPVVVMEQILAAIKQSRLAIADLTNRSLNVMFEVGYAHSAGKPLILLDETSDLLPFDIAHQRVLVYGRDLDTARLNLTRAIAFVLSEERVQDATNLFNDGKYRGAIAASAVALEHRMRQMLASFSSADLRSMSLGQMLEALQKHKILHEELSGRLRGLIVLRDRAIHEVEEPTKEQAQFALSAIGELMTELPDGWNDFPAP